MEIISGVERSRNAYTTSGRTSGTKQQVSEPIHSLQVSERITAGFAVALKVAFVSLNNRSRTRATQVGQVLMIKSVALALLLGTSVVVHEDRRG